MQDVVREAAVEESKAAAVWRTRSCCERSVLLRPVRMPAVSIKRAGPFLDIRRGIKVIFRPNDPSQESTCQREGR
jgi:hypothetical protein